MSTAFTFYWSDIFPDWQTFAKFNEDYAVIGFYKNGVADPTISEFLQYCYKLLSRYFWKANIRYSDVNSFCRALANVLEDRFYQFKKQKELIDKAYKLTDEDIEQIQESLQNVADNPNTVPDDPRKPLQYISSQAFGFVKENRLKAYLRAINEMPNLRINEFIRGRAEYADEISFLDLFMNVQPNTDYLYTDKE